MRDILFLAHRIPYPPDKGDKIRAWNVLRHLSAKHHVHLAVFIDEPEDVHHVEALERICASVVWRPLSTRVAKLRSLSCLLSGAPLTQGYFGDRRMRAAIDGLIERHRPSLFYVFSSAMAPYVADHRGTRVILDMVDVDSEKWRQYAAASSGLKRHVYARESRTLLAFERQAAATADAVLFVSRAEAELFTRLAPEAAAHTYGIRNGIDTDHFTPSLDFPNPFGARASLVFTGVMNYRPNVDAMIWFVEQVMPKLRKHPAAPVLWIVGSSPSRGVLALAGPDIHVTGRVPDVRPYLRHANVVVAPLQIARGIQNKVLEAMAMGAPVVATPQACEGLDGCSENELLTAASANVFADAVTRVLDDNGSQIGGRARARVVRDFRWAESLDTLDRIINEETNEPVKPSRMPVLAPVSAA
jgi:sugar transferase (PEP-CTERM/EpsH1 system associated)